MFSKIWVEYLFKNYVIFWGGRGEVIKRSHWITGGRGGGQDGPIKDHIIFERSLRYFFMNISEFFSIMTKNIVPIITDFVAISSIFFLMPFHMCIKIYFNYCIKLAFVTFKKLLIWMFFCVQLTQYQSLFQICTGYIFETFFINTIVAKLSPSPSLIGLS